MAMSDSTLAAELKAVPLFDNEPDAAAAWANAFDVYFQDAEATAGGPVVPAGLSACKSAMEGALSGMSAPGAGAAALQAGILAYWGGIVPATAWATCTGVTPPPGMSALAATLTPVFLANTAPGVTKDQAMDAIAAAIHGVNIVGGIAVFPVPPAGIGPQPIL